jgi:hypothetical protein
MPSKNTPLDYALSIQQSVNNLDGAFKKTNGASTMIFYINNIRTNISNLQAYLEKQLELASDKYKYLNTNRNLLPDYINKLISIKMAANILSNSIDEFSNINKRKVLSNQSEQMDNIKKSVKALEDSTKGFVEFGLQTNGNGTVTTTLFTEQEPSRVIEGYVSNSLSPRPPRSPIIFDPRGKGSINRSQKKMQQTQQQNTTGGRRSRRNSKKTRRSKKHYRRRTRRV